MNLEEGQFDFSGGMNTVKDPILLGQNQYAYMLNGELINGKPRTRRGYVQRIAAQGSSGDPNGIGVFRNPTTMKEIIIFVRGGTYYKSGINGSPEEISTPSSSYTGAVHFVQAYDYLYIFRGADNAVWRWDGVNDIEEVIYTYSTTLSSVDASLSSSIEITLTDAVNWTVGQTVNNVRSSATAEILTKNSTTNFIIDADPADIADWIATDEVNVTQAGSGPDPIPQADRGEYTANRLWVFHDYDILDASDILSPTVFDYTNQQFQVNRGDGDKIVRILGYNEDTVLVFKEGSVLAITNLYSSFGEQVVKVLDPTEGCVAPETVIPVGNDVFYMGRHGINSLQQTEQSKIQKIALPASFQIQNEFDNVNWLYAENAQAVHFDNYYILAYPDANSITNTSLLIFSFIINAWVSKWTFAVGVKKFFKATLNGKRELFFHGTDNAIYRMFASEYWDNDDTDIDFEFTTRGVHFSNHREKYLQKSEVEIKNRNAKFTINHYALGGVFEEREIREDVEYDYTKWDTANQDDFEEDNSDDNINDPYRQDYSPCRVPTGGLTVPSGGIYIDVAQRHAVDINTRALGKAFQFNIVNSQGSIEINSVIMIANEKDLGRGK